ncbi:Radical SAM domain-containing protein [Planctomycetales bacterium 10988]|nr:Radical SAM domain-containing protein [Planctomycetales bacterium 10988]
MPPSQPSLPRTHSLHTQHERSFDQNRFVYPVLSRRSQGISIGINLNPNKVCNFDCIYCQVDRRSESETKFVETESMLAELEGMLELTTSGQLYQTEKFQATPPELRRLNDMAFSGDGEPTTYRNFDDIVSACAALKRQFGLDEVKMVLITNASMFHRPQVQRGLEVLAENQGEIWAKLDAGTSDYYHFIDRTRIPFDRILNNITNVAKERPLVIQSLFMKVENEPPSLAEQHAYCDRLNEIQNEGGQIKYVQLYTVARRPAESFVSPLEDDELDRFATLVQERTSLQVETFYGRKTD